MSSRKAAIVGGVRIPFTKSLTQYTNDSSQELMTFTLEALVQKYGLQGKRLDEVALGAVMKHSNEWNLSRESVLGTSLDARTPAYDLQRACGTSLSAAMQISDRIKLGQIEVGIAGGVDTNSDTSIGLSRPLSRALVRASMARTFGDKLKIFASLRPSSIGLERPGITEPRTGLSMGQHCEKMAKDWQITRLAQDELALRSHLNAAKAYEAGFYDDLVVEYRGIKKDTIVRADTTLEKLQKLRPAFDSSPAGTLTAGNSSPLTDGSACCLIASEDYATKNNLPILAYVKDTVTTAVDFVKDEGLLMAPAYAVPQLLKRNNLTLQDFDYYEIHEAFAAQVLCTLAAWESKEFCRHRLGLDQALGSIDRSKLNTVGSSIALGHPFAATGARIVATLAKLLNKKGSGRGLISICTAGGMGVTAILEK
jgi:acetyl-CoA C-acetyltransferase